MPPSKRARILPTSKTPKNHKALVTRLHANIRAAALQYRCIYVFAIHNARNTALKELRSLLPTSRIFMGKTKVMGHALGLRKEDAVVDGCEGLVGGGYVKGEVGLLFTDLEEEGVRSVAGGFRRVGFARAGVVAERGFVVGTGELYTVRNGDGGAGGEEELLPLGIEPTLRKLGVPTRLVKGRVVLEESADGEGQEGYVVCRQGEVLDSRQTAILKIFGVRMAEFRVELRAVFEKGNGVRKIGGEESMEE